jgi:hypothetical protein
LLILLLPPPLTQGCLTAMTNSAFAPMLTQDPALGARNQSITVSANANSAVRFISGTAWTTTDVRGDAVKASRADGLPADGAIRKQMRPGFTPEVSQCSTLPWAPASPSASAIRKGTVLQGTLPFPELDFRRRQRDRHRPPGLCGRAISQVFVTFGFYLYAGPAKASFLVSGKARVQAGCPGHQRAWTRLRHRNQIRKVDFAAVGRTQFENGLGLKTPATTSDLSSLDTNNRFDARTGWLKWVPTSPSNLF